MYIKHDEYGLERGCSRSYWSTLTSTLLLFLLLQSTNPIHLLLLSRQGNLQPKCTGYIGEWGMPQRFLRIWNGTGPQSHLMILSESLQAWKNESDKYLRPISWFYISAVRLRSRLGLIEIPPRVDRITHSLGFSHFSALLMHYWSSDKSIDPLTPTNWSLDPCLIDKSLIIVLPISQMHPFLTSSVYFDIDNW